MDPFLGEIKLVGFNFAPRGYAFCDGALMAISQNSALFALLGTTYGGDGVTTFALPDYRSRNPLGMGAGPGLSPVVQGEKSGLELATLQTANMPQHNHTAVLASASATPKAFNGAADLADPTGAAPANAAANPRDLPIPSFAAASTAVSAMAPIPVSGTVDVGMAGSNQPLSLRNPYLGTNFIIATEGIFPSRN